MRTAIASVLVTSLVGASGYALAPSRQQTQPASATNPPPIEEILKAVRTDLQMSRADVISKNVTLSAEQAAKFWPVFNQYQSEQNAIMDAQMKGLQNFVDHFEKLDDAAAIDFMKTHLDRDQKMAALRLKWLSEFRKVLPAKLAVRVLQIDRRVSLAHQVEFSSRLPLVQ